MVTARRLGAYEHSHLLPLLDQRRSSALSLSATFMVCAGSGSRRRGISGRSPHRERHHAGVPAAQGQQSLPLSKGGRAAGRHAVEALHDAGRLVRMQLFAVWRARVKSTPHGTK